MEVGGKFLKDWPGFLFQISGPAFFRRTNPKEKIVNRFEVSKMTDSQLKAWREYVQNRIAYAEATENKVLAAIWKAAQAQLPKP
jgi:hypothetical protein